MYAPELSCKKRRVCYLLSLILTLSQDSADNDHSFCNDHSQCDAEAQETWLLHRDILHALIMPIVALFSRASALAEAALCTRRTEDLELAFAGEARGAFLCLQCILTEEEEWCKGMGCPGMYII